MSARALAGIEPAEVKSILNAARSTNFGDRREIERHPFFHPVTITRMAGEPQNLSAYSRDISAGGMGLLHNMPLATGDVTLTIQDNAGDSARLSGEIMWCRPCGEGWFTSGMRFHIDAING